MTLNKGILGSVILTKVTTGTIQHWRQMYLRCLQAVLEQHFYTFHVFTVVVKWLFGENGNMVSVFVKRGDH